MLIKAYAVLESYFYKSRHNIMLYIILLQNTEIVKVLNRTQTTIFGTSLSCVKENLYKIKKRLFLPISLQIPLPHSCFPKYNLKILIARWHDFKNTIVDRIQHDPLFFTKPVVHGPIHAPRAIIGFVI